MASFVVGETVKLQNLSKESLNGLDGEIVANFDTDSGRYAVKLLSTGAVCNVKPANLLSVAKPPAASEPVAASDAARPAAAKSEFVAKPRGCANCGAVGVSVTCQGCGIAGYCSKECRKAHKKAHKASCKAAVIASTETWPHAVVGPRGMPELYPGPPLWVRNISEFLAGLDMPPPAPLPLLTAVLSSYKTQVEMDERMAKLRELYQAVGGDKNDAELPLADHIRISAQAGYRLKLPKVAPGESVKTKDLFESNAYIFDEGWEKPADYVEPTYLCTQCKTVASARCACGEVYCSRACQEADWKHHKGVCDQVRENSSLGMTYTKIWWSLQGIGSTAVGRRMK